MALYHVVERFISINGEGTRCGQLSVFIRFAGCNLNCSFCDTTWANEADVPYETLSEEALYNYICSTGIKNITLTGGEPLLVPDMLQLLTLLSKDESIYVEIETNGSIDLEPFSHLEHGPHFTMDYKLPQSGMESFMNTDNFARLTKDDTVKFVVGDIHDLTVAKRVIDEYQLLERCSIYFSPVFGSIDPQQIVQFMIDNKLNHVNLQLQLHKIIWSPDERGV